VYVLDYDNGGLYTLAANKVEGDSWKKFPRTLTASGLFKDVPNHIPSEGVYEFEIQSPQWQDGATAQRLVALPGAGAINWYDEPRPIPGQVVWHNYQLHPPKDAVYVKTISLETEVGNPKTRRRVETQLLHFDGEQFRGYSYAWRDDQSDADLVSGEGADKDFEITDASLPFPKRRLTWNYLSRAQCLQCHNSWAEGTLGFQIPQLQKKSLEKLCSLDLLKRFDKQGKNIPQASPELLKISNRLANPASETEPLEARARAYLHANCGHCHRFGGGGSVQVVLNAEMKKEEMKAIGVVPQQGSFNIREGQLIYPGHPEKSILAYRLSKFGSGRMPHLASDWPDLAGARLVAAWIQSLKSEQATTAPGTQDSTSALQAILNWKDFTKEQRLRLVNEARQTSDGFVKDLFEGYFPLEPGERKLGSNPKPQKILALVGDVERGKALFFRESLQCISCHKIGEKGLNVGPELTKIGAKRRKAELLESILLPSRRIEQEYQVLQISTMEGKQISGLVVRKSGNSITLKDAKNQETTIATQDIEKSAISSISLMPEGLVRDLTPQQAADLVEFLESLK
jgi:putative heme-binding domain-containing protein